MRFHEKPKGTIMNNFGQNVPEMPSTFQTMFELVVFLWVAASLVAIGVAFWIYKDAELRGKNGAAAALIVVLSVFFSLLLQSLFCVRGSSCDPKKLAESLRIWSSIYRTHFPRKLLLRLRRQNS